MKVMLSKYMPFFNVFFKTLGFFFALLVIVILISIFTLINTDNSRNSFLFKEGNKDSDNIIAVLNIYGPIIHNVNGLLTNNIYNFISPTDLKKSINELISIKPKVLIVKIDSPGGTVSATNEVAQIFKDFKKNSNTQIFFLTENMLASGGYWVATMGDKIFAKYGSIIGSIGVSGPSWFYYNKPISISSGLLGKNIKTEKGIEIFSQNSGISKDLFNPFRKPTETELNHLQNMIDEIYSKFLNVVSKNRKIEKQYLENEIGALIYTSKQAKDNFLIDDILSYDDLIKIILRDNNYKDYKIIEIDSSINLFERYFTSYNYNNNEIICSKLTSNFVTIIPNFFKDC